MIFHKMSNPGLTLTICNKNHSTAKNEQFLLTNDKEFFQLTCQVLSWMRIHSEILKLSSFLSDFSSAFQ